MQPKKTKDSGRNSQISPTVERRFLSRSATVRSPVQRKQHGAKEAHQSVAGPEKQSQSRRTRLAHFPAPPTEPALPRTSQEN